MLNTDVNEILYDADGSAWGIKCGNEVAKGTMLIGDPTYFPKEKIRPTGKVIRSICFLNHVIPGTNNAESTQIVIPGAQVGRTNDIFVSMVGAGHNISSQGIYIASVTTRVETSNPVSEVEAGLKLLGPIMKQFNKVSETYEPVGDGLSDRCFISSSFDGTSHFEGDCDDLLDLYERVTGQKLDMNIDASSVEAEE